MLSGALSIFWGNERKTERKTERNLAFSFALRCSVHLPYLPVERFRLYRNFRGPKLYNWGYLLLATDLLACVTRVLFIDNSTESLVSRSYFR